MRWEKKRTNSGGLWSVKWEPPPPPQLWGVRSCWRCELLFLASSFSFSWRSLLNGGSARSPATSPAPVISEESWGFRGGCGGGGRPCRQVCGQMFTNVLNVCEKLTDFTAVSVFVVFLAKLLCFTANIDLVWLKGSFFWISLNYVLDVFKRVFRECLFKPDEAFDVVSLLIYISQFSGLINKGVT